MTTWWCEHAWVDLPHTGAASGASAAPTPRCRITAGADGRITAVETDVDARPGDHVLHGVVVPGFANAHSHAFHRALRGRTHGEGGTFWAWRQHMYALADLLTPDSYRELATAAFAEMALAGITCVGEFHYLHHGVGGARYLDPNAMGEALRDAAHAAGVRMTLLDACYLRGGIDVALEGVQRRYDDGDAYGWADRVSMMTDDDHVRIGAAIHSVRAVPADQLAVVAQAALGDDGTARPVHVHLSEQPVENEVCLRAYGLTPTQLLAEHGVLGPHVSAVHATHLCADDVALLGGSGTTVCMCPTTERDLADGVGPARDVADAGSPITLGTDQHAVVDMFAEAQGLEMHERLQSGHRGRFSVPEVLQALAPAGHRSLGWPEAGALRVGCLADLVSVRLDSIRTAGALPAQVLLVASATDIDTVVVGGRVVVDAGRHVLEHDGPPLALRMAGAVAAAWSTT